MGKKNQLPFFVFSRYKHADRGFTLIELLIAMVIFAIMATLAYGGLGSVIRSGDKVEEQMARLEHLQRTVMFLERDFRQLAPRTMNTEVLEVTGAVVMSPSSAMLIEFTRGGQPNPAGLQRSSLQRVAYQLDDEKGILYRLVWDSVDHLQDSEPTRLELLDQVNTVDLTLLDENNQWQTKWEQYDNQAQLPLAVEFVIDHKYWGKIRRLIPVFGY